MDNDEPLYLNSDSGAHAHMTDAGEKICRDVKNCPVWIEYDTLNERD